MAALGSSLLCAGFCWLLLARVHGVAKGRAWLSDWHFHFFTFQLQWVGLPFSDVCWLLITVASLVAEHRFWVHGLSCSVGSSWIRNQTHVSCIGRWILSHRVTREALGIISDNFMWLCNYLKTSLIKNYVNISMVIKRQVSVHSGWSEWPLYSLIS